MLNNKGSTLIEALFAFSVYTIVLVMFVSLMTTLNQSSLTIVQRQKETAEYEMHFIEEGGDVKSMIEEALH